MGDPLAGSSLFALVFFSLCVHSLLVDLPGDGTGNYDHDNRKAAPKDVTHPGPIPVTPDQITRDVVQVVQARFDTHFGTLQHFEYAVTRADALRALDHFIAHALPRFGDYQDAMLRQLPSQSRSFLFGIFTSILKSNLW